MLLAMLLAALAAPEDFQTSFPVDRKNLVPMGSNAYFILLPGYRLYYVHGKDTMTVTVLEETRIIDGVTTRAVEVRETKKGQLIEVTRDYFAIDSATGDVYYFGEDVDMYKKGKVTGHQGTWHSGVNGARFGLMMPAKIRLGHKFYQELAPGVAMDRAEVVAVDDKVAVPAGTFERCIQFKESTPLEIGSERKWYGPGVGLLKDGEFVLVKIEKPK